MRKSKKNKCSICDSDVTGMMYLLDKKRICRKCTLSRMEDKDELS